MQVLKHSQMPQKSTSIFTHRYTHMKQLNNSRRKEACRGKQLKTHALRQVPTITVCTMGGLGECAATFIVVTLRSEKAVRGENRGECFTWSLRDGAVRRGVCKSQSLTKPMTVVRSTMLSDFSKISKHAAERDWNTFLLFGMAPRAVMFRSSFKQMTSACM